LSLPSSGCTCRAGRPHRWAGHRAGCDGPTCGFRSIASTPRRSTRAVATGGGRAGGGGLQRRPGSDRLSACLPGHPRRRSGGRNREVRPRVLLPESGRDSVAAAVHQAVPAVVSIGRSHLHWGFAGSAFVLIEALPHSGRWRGWIAESTSRASSQVVARPGGVTRRRRFDRMATVCHPDSGRLKVSVGPVAVHYLASATSAERHQAGERAQVAPAEHSATGPSARTTRSYRHNRSRHPNNGPPTRASRPRSLIHTSASKGC
jgi:hypothetical protein